METKQERQRRQQRQRQGRQRQRRHENEDNDNEDNDNEDNDNEDTKDKHNKDKNMGFKEFKYNIPSWLSFVLVRLNLFQLNLADQEFAFLSKNLYCKIYMDSIVPEPKCCGV